MRARRRSSESDAELFENVEVDTLREGSYVVINDRPSKVAKLVRSKKGSYGHAKFLVVASDIVTGSRREMIVKSGHNCMVPTVVKTEYMVLYANEDGFVSLMDSEGSLRDDLQLPESGVAKEVRRALAANEDGENSVVVSVLSAMGESHVAAARTVEGDW